MQFSLSSMTRNWSLKNGIHHLEDIIIVISGPALAVSGIIAGLDLLTGGSILKDSHQLAMIWAVSLLLTLDFQVLCLGVRFKRIYHAQGKWYKKFAELALCVAVAAGISYVSVQMQSVVARTTVDNQSISIQAAEQSLGIDGNALIWERSSLVLVLIFMSGLARGNDETPERVASTSTAAVTPAATPAPVAPVPAPVQQPAIDLAQLTESVTENVVRRLEPQLAAMTALVERVSVRLDSVDQQQALPEPEARPALPEPDNDQKEAGDVQNVQGVQDDVQGDVQGAENLESIFQPIFVGNFVSKEEAVKAAIAQHPGASDEEIARLATCTVRTVRRWRTA